MKYLDTRSIPEIYNLYLNIDLLNDKFNGYNLVKLNINKPTDIIEFHGLELNIDYVELNDNKKYYSDNLIYDDQNDIWKLKLDNVLEIGEYKIRIVFNSIFNTAAGLVKYVNKIKNNRTVIFTRFEPNYARKCFPCWDEPHLKVKYNMSIEINDLSYQVYFNTDPISIKKTQNQSILYHFEETIPMSTYVSSFMIGKFYYVEAYTKKNIRLRVFIPSDIPNSEHLASHALDSGIKIMDYISDYYQTPYPFNKMDFIPIDNVDAKGMENYGLIFYDAPWLLYDKKVSLLDHKIGISNVIAHELAHQWFGNLITMYRWDELWLKESFAKFFEYYIVDKIYPEWEIKSFFIKHLFRTLEFDSVSLKPVKVKVTHNKHLMQIYDDITYFKGATLLFMLVDYLGEDYFKNSIRSYIKKYKYSTITSTSFIESLCENLNNLEKEEVNQMIQTFISNKGIPIIRFSKDEVDLLSFNTRTIINNHINNITKDDYTNNWVIPIRVKDKKYFISNSNLRESYLTINNIPIQNNKNVCYYRISYNDEQFNILLETIHTKTAHQHMSILNDLFILGVYSISKFKNWLIYINKLINNMCTYDKTELYDYYLFSSINQTVNNISSFFKDEYLNAYFNKEIINRSKLYYKKYLTRPLKKLVSHMSELFKVADINTYTQNDLSINKLHQNKLIFYLLDINKFRLKHVLEHFIDNNMFDIYGDLNQILFKYMMLQDDLSYLMKLKTIAELNKDLYPMIMMSFKFTKNKKVIKNIFDKFIDGNQMDISYVQINQLLGSNKYFIELYTNYFINNYEEYIKIMPLDSKAFTYVLNQLILNQTKPEIIEKLFDKLNSINNTKFILKMKSAKSVLFNKLFLKINTIKKLNSIN